MSYTGIKDLHFSSDSFLTQTLNFLEVLFSDTRVFFSLKSGEKKEEYIFLQRKIKNGEIKIPKLKNKGMAISKTKKTKKKPSY